LASTHLPESTLTELAATHLAESSLAKLATTKTVLAELTASKTPLAKLAELPAGPTQHVARLNRYHRVGATRPGGPHNSSGCVGPIGIVVTRSVDSAISNRATRSSAKSALAKLSTSKLTCSHLAESSLAKLAPKPGLAQLPTSHLPPANLAVAPQLTTTHLATTPLLPSIDGNHWTHGWGYRLLRWKRGPVLGHQAPCEQPKRQKTDQKACCANHGESPWFG